MKKKLKTVLVVSVMGLMLAGCGSNYGHEDVRQMVKDGTYSIENDPVKKALNPTSTETTVEDMTVATVSDSSTEGVFPWVVEMKDFSEIDDNFKNMLVKVDGFTCTMYVGYRVENNSIRYAFVGNKGDNPKTMVYIIQDVKDNLTIEYGNYDEDMYNIMSD